MKRLLQLFLILVFAMPFMAQAKDHDVWFDLPLYDYPFNNTDDNPPNFFSMRQSMALSTSYYQTAHRLIGGSTQDTHGTFLRYLMLGAYDYLTMTVPIGAAWVHEEWHRSVMTSHKISSFNEVNAWPWTSSGTIAVDHVTDEDLIRLKRDNPADQVRLSAAGMEAQVFQNQKLEESHFFHGRKTRDEALLWLNTLNVTSYMSQCAGLDSDTTTNEEMEEEGANIKARDFTGLDCNAWVYDLFRPDEAYAARGTHPSGVGIKRYIRWSDLNEKEQSYLKLQSQLSLLNFVDPFLIGITSFDGPWGRWNFKMNHYLASFGGNVDMHLFMNIDHHKWLFTLHNGMTNSGYFPGLTVKWVEAELGKSVYVTLSGTGWLQPKDQRFDSTTSDFVSSGSMELMFYAPRSVEYYLGVETKTAGWIAGNVYLDSNVSTYTGVRIGLF